MGRCRQTGGRALSTGLYVLEEAADVADGAQPLAHGGLRMEDGYFARVQLRHRSAPRTVRV